MSNKIYDFNSEVSKQEGKFIRSPSKFRNQVTSHTIPNSDSNRTNEQFNSKFPVEADRYTLYLAHACPWCHRTDLVRVLKGLESVIRVIYVDPILTDQGWRFSQPETDSGLNATLLREIYLQSDPNYEGKCTVPVLYDRKQHLIVNNESSEIIRMMNEQFNELATRNRELDLYPFEFRKEIDLVNSWIYENINDGVYKCGFAQTQYAYEEAFHALFKALLKVENILSRQRYLVAGVKHLTEADIRLVVTLLRFDAVYYTHFKCNLKTLRFGFPNLHNYMKDVYQSFDGILKSTFHVEKTKQHYFGSHRKINPFGIVPLGPELDLDSPPANREFSQIHETVNH
ncbi:hypothetical protein C9374_008343 [Naegleria lovaniensis]|uniref:GST N-terminal domain-containing protein n=1 Tax=Naegleria lovaniensis TaxID=51637 RepID=A0AA88GK00_NAELO|nr:uncharacterized protein C9374_008343 [Naegleria lovaniensis]KAG2378200.1 hypothetical protein C9374_008343 [Naegleria lovaniensis]